MSLIRNGVQLATTGVSDYEQLRNLPKINNTELKGNVTIDASNIVEVSALPTSNISSDKLYKFNNGLWWHNGIQWIMVSSSASVADGTGITINAATGAINHSNAVTAGTAGQQDGSSGAVKVPKITYDAQGHITSKEEITTYPPTSVGTSGQYWKSDGSGQGAWQTPGAITENNANLVTGGTVYEYLQNNGGGGGGEWTQAKIIDLIYPVHSIYIAYEDVDPTTIFGGRWVRIAEGKMLLSAGDTYTAGSTGGAASMKYTPTGTNSGTSVIMNPVTLVAGNIPKLTTAAAGDHTHDRGTMEIKGSQRLGWKDKSGGGVIISKDNMGNSGCFASPTSTGIMGYSGNSQSTASDAYNTINFQASKNWTGSTSSAGSHTHTVGNATASSFTPTTNTVTNPTFTGTEATINTMSPYIAVYMWRRIM